MTFFSSFLNKLKRFLRLYKVFFIQFVKKLVEYRLDFMTGCIAFFSGQIFNLLFIFLIFENIPNLAGWSINEIIFIYGFSQIPRGIDHFFTDELWRVAHFHVYRGNFDKYLTRPIDTLHHVLMEGFQPDALGELITGIVLLVISGIKLQLTISFSWIILMLIAIIGGTFIYTGIKIVFTSFAFKMKKSGNLLFIVYMTSDFARYPITIYNEFIKTLITYVIPFAFTAFYPASFLIRGNSLLFSIGMPVLMGAVWMLIGRLFWNHELKYYESAGS